MDNIRHLPERPRDNDLWLINEYHGAAEAWAGSPTNLNRPRPTAAEVFQATFDPETHGDAVVTYAERCLHGMAGIIAGDDKPQMTQQLEAYLDLLYAFSFHEGYIDENNTELSTFSYLGSAFTDPDYARTYLQQAMAEVSNTKLIDEATNIVKDRLTKGIIDQAEAQLMVLGFLAMDTHVSTGGIDLTELKTALQGVYAQLIDRIHPAEHSISPGRQFELIFARAFVALRSHLQLLIYQTSRATFDDTTLARAISTVTEAYQSDLAGQLRRIARPLFDD